MKFMLKFGKNEGWEDINNFTLANAIYNMCIKHKVLLDVEIIAKMLLLQCKKFVEVEDNGN